jgi:hypothetical protein
MVTRLAWRAQRLASSKRWTRYLQASKSSAMLLSLVLDVDARFHCFLKRKKGRALPPHPDTNLWVDKLHGDLANLFVCNGDCQVPGRNHRIRIILASRANGSLWRSRSVDFWYLRISRRATVPGRYRCGFLRGVGPAIGSPAASITQIRNMGKEQRAPTMLHSRLVLAAVLRPPVDFLATWTLPGLLVDASLLLFFCAAFFFRGLGVVGVAISMYGDETGKENNVPNDRPFLLSAFLSSGQAHPALLIVRLFRAQVATQHGQCHHVNKAGRSSDYISRQSFPRLFGQLMYIGIQAVGKASVEAWKQVRTSECHSSAVI